MKHFLLSRVRRQLVPFALVAVAALACGLALSQATPAAAPTENKGVTSKPLAALELGGDIPELAGRQLRARAITIEPGGNTAVHTHQGRPTLEYVQAGNVVEVRNGVEVPHAAGEMVPASNGVTHYWVNRGIVPVVLVPVDVFKP